MLTIIDSLKNGVFVVTGGASGLGLAIVKGLLVNGSVVHCISRNKTISNHAELKLLSTEYPDNFYVHNFDLTDRKRCQNFAKTIVKNHTRINGLINNAGVMIYGNINDVDIPSLMHGFQNNVFSLINITQALWPLLIRHQGNTIVNVSSAAARTGNPIELVYSATKGAIEAINRSLAREGGKFGLSVNAVAPHVINSGMGSKSLDIDPTIVDRIPFQRSGHVDEYVNLVLFLASGSSPYLSGQTIHLNGGRLMMG